MGNDNELIRWLASLPGEVAQSVLRSMELQDDERKFIMEELVGHWLTAENPFDWFNELKDESPDFVSFLLKRGDFDEQQRDAIRVVIYFNAELIWSQTKNNVLYTLLKNILLRRHYGGDQ